jgi:phage terminase large subunit
VQIIPIYFRHFKQNAKERFVGLVGSSRSGKTYSGLQWLFFLAQMGIKFECTVVGRSIPFLRDGAVNSFREIANGYTIIRSPFSVKIKNASFLFRSFENENDAKGAERDFLYLNECNDLEYKVVQQLIMRTRIQTIVDFNPTKRFWIDEYTSGSNLLKTTWKDNPYLAESQKENFAAIKHRAELPNASAYDKYLYSVFYLGEYGDMRGNVFGRLSECTVAEYESLTKHSRKLYGLDFGFSQDPCALIEMSMVLGVIYIRYLLYQNQLNDFQLSEILKEYCDASNPIVCDFGGGGDARMSNIFQLTGLTLVKATKGPNSIKTGVELLNTYPIVVCGEHAMKEFSSYEFVDDSFSEKDNHGIDSARYAIDYAVRANYFNIS